MDDTVEKSHFYNTSPELDLERHSYQTSNYLNLEYATEP